MKSPTNPLTRTCNTCGIEKLLSAFLQLGGAHGAHYGKICSQCRGRGKTEKSGTPIIDEEQSTTPTGIGIRGKEKLYADTKREQKIQNIKELNLKEKIKKQDVTNKKGERNYLKEISDKKQRETYFSQKNPLNSQPNQTNNTKIIARQQTEQEKNIRTGEAQQKQTLETKKQEHINIIQGVVKEEIKKTSTDFNNLFHAIEPGRIEMQGELGRFFTWLGNSAPIVRTLNRSKSVSGTAKEPVTETNNPTDPTNRSRG